MRKTTTLFTTAALLSVAGLAHGQITVESVFSYADNNADNAEGLGIFNASAFDKLVVIVSGEHGFPNNTSGINISGVTYDGVAMIAAVTRDGLPEVDNVSPDQGYNHMYYLDAPFGTTGTIEVSSTLSRMVVTAIGLDGTAEGIGATAISGLSTKSVDLTTTGTDSYVIASNGLGGTGNNGGVSGLTTNSPLTFLSSVQTNSNYAGHVIGGANVATASTNSYSFTGGTAGSHVIAAEFLLGPPPAVMTLRANTTNGVLTMIGDDGEPISFSYYEIKSAGNSLTTAGWKSLADQDYDGNGPANGSGNGWEEAGGSNSSSLAEAYLLGNSEIAVDQLLSLGIAYNTVVDARDIEMRYLTDRGKIYDAVVTYFSPLMGDVNNDGSVGFVDLNLLLGQYGGATTGQQWSTGDLTGDGDIQFDDLNLLVGNYGSSAAAESALAAASIEATLSTGDVQLIINADGSLAIEGDAASIISYQILSEAGLLIPDADGADLGLLSYAANNVNEVAAFGLSPVAVDGVNPIDATVSTLTGLDLVFSYGLANGQTVSGTVVVIPEPSSMALLGLAGLLVSRRRRY